MPLDHNNVFYLTNADMARAYGMNPNTLKYRLREWKRRGASIEKILTTPVLQSGTVFDHACESNEYDGIERDIIGPDGVLHKNVTWIEYCKIFSINTYETFRGRIAYGKDVNDDASASLQTDRKTRCVTCTDHLGNVFDSIVDKCDYYNIPYETYSARIHRNKWSEQKALTTPVRNNSPKSVLDPNDILWESESKMCKHWKIDRRTYKLRMLSGKYDMLESLTMKTYQTKRKD